MGVVRIGLIGTGWGASVTAPALRCVAGAELVALTSGRLERAQAAAQQYGVRHAFADYRAMLRSVELDLVFIVTPPYLHYEMTMAALEAGTHVICEKPFALDAGQARAMVEAAARAGRVNAVDHEFRYVPARLALARLLAAGAIGEPFFIRSADLAAREMAKYYGWWYDRARGGGLLGAIGSHFVDAILHQWGGPFARVSAELRAVIPERPREDGTGTERVTADDTALIAFQLTRGVTGRIDLSITAPGGPRRTEIYGTEGTLILEGSKLYRPVDGSLVEIVPEQHEQGRLEDPRLGPTVELAQRVVDRINGIDSGSFATFADGLEVQRVLDAIHRSSDERREVAIAEIP